MSQTRFAKEVGLSKQYINKLVKKGVIPSYEKGQVKFDEAKAALEAHRDPHRERQRQKNAEERLRKKIPSLMEAAGGYDSVADMSEEERRRESIERLKKLRSEAKSAGAEVVVSGEDIERLDIKELNRLILEQDLRLKKIKADEAERKLVAIEEVERLFFAAARTIRDGMTAIPARVAARIAATVDPHEVRTLLEDEIAGQLANLTEVLHGIKPAD